MATREIHIGAYTSNVVRPYIVIPQVGLMQEQYPLGGHVPLEREIINVCDVFEI